MKSVSIVTPFYNEEECVTEFVSRTDNVLSKLNLNYEIILVNDGSTDKTSEIMDELAKKYYSLKVIHLSKNRGQAIAVYAGIQNSKNDWVVIMDGDLQHLPEEIPLLLLEMQKGYDFVSGSRKKRSESFIFRKLPSLMANFLLRRIANTSIRDMGGFKVVRGDLLRQLQIRPGQHRYLPAIFSIMGARLGEVFISAPPRYKGVSKYGIGIGRTIDVVFDIIMLWFLSANKSRPIYTLGRISIYFAFIPTVILCFLVYQKLELGFDIHSRPIFLISCMLYVFSAIILSFGITLEIITSIFNTTAKSYPYIINRTTSINEKK